MTRLFRLFVCLFMKVYFAHRDKQSNSRLYSGSSQPTPFLASLTDCCAFSTLPTWPLILHLWLLFGSLPRFLEIDVTIATEVGKRLAPVQDINSHAKPMAPTKYKPIHVACCEPVIIVLKIKEHDSRVEKPSVN